MQVLSLAGSSALVGICADATHVCVVDQSHQKVRPTATPFSSTPRRKVLSTATPFLAQRRPCGQVRVLSLLQGEGRAAFGPPRAGEPHLRLFLLPTSTCDTAPRTQCTPHAVAPSSRRTAESVRRVLHTGATHPFPCRTCRTGATPTTRKWSLSRSGSSLTAAPPRAPRRPCARGCAPTYATRCRTSRT